MHTYEDKEEIKAEIKKVYNKYISEFNIILERLKDMRADNIDRTSIENLAYQVGWTTYQ